MSSTVGTRMCAAAIALVAGCRDESTATPDTDGTSTSTGESTGTGSESGDPLADSSTGEPGPRFCRGAFAVRYDPNAPGIDAFPDDLWTDDAETRTGVQLRSPFATLAEDDPMAGFPSVFTRLPTLDGFGTTAPVFLRVGAPVDAASLPAPGTEADPLMSTLLMVDLDADPVVFVAFEWRLVAEHGEEDGTTVILAPLRPLRSDGRYGVVMTNGVTDESGDCFAPSPAMQELLEGTATDPLLTRLDGRYADLIDALREAGTIAEPHELSAAIVYTTATTIRQSTAIATAISLSLPSPLALEECFSSGYPWFDCRGVLSMVDFTDADGIVTGTAPQSTYEVPVIALVPQAGDGPFPTVIFGHALTGDRTSALYSALELVPQGYAVLAIDAPKHGDHPDPAITNPTFDLLGLSNDPADPFDPFDARDNFRQAAFDKLQLVHRVVAGMDVTGDGDPDFDPEHLHYIGHSLGAAMGPQLLAYTDAFVQGTLVVGGGNLTNIVDQASEFQPLVGLVTQDFSEAERARLLAITQTAIDGGDPMAYAPFVVADRLDGFDARAPHVLAQMALDDTVVPNSSTAYLVRALGIPIVGEAKLAMRGVEVIDVLPVRGNMGGGLTAGLYQFDRMAGDAGVLLEATHRGLQSDPYAFAQQLEFRDSLDDPRGPQIIDPFAN